ncbi:low temperature requirement protein A [Streptosporangium sandarakinum]|uniref:Low temperature requirement protein LtrA n=1 Tax=Streptosporangium sandarakinum TaxID=1260955 RepID=A0A852V630_9ACTN|nr:low temperature requirement protein A [Streptosporangium sandarakinum]NYF41425.1 low temperature requirement protein LtrA [Streptosporangium sandarakinum]
MKFPLPQWFTERVDPVPDHEELRVSTIELFFDLVFVFTATQLTVLLAADFGSLPQVLLMFGVIWWMFASYAWVTNAVPPLRVARRFFMLLAMAGWLIIALAVPGAFAEKGTGFAIGLFVIVVVHGLMYLQSTWRFLRMFTTNLTGAVLILLAAQADGGLKYALWAAALLVMWISPYLTGQEGFPLHPGHVAERHGLVVIIALGESVVAIAVGIGNGHGPLDAPTIGTALIGLALSASLWWAYFHADLERAEQALVVVTEQVRRTRLVLFGFFYAHMPILLGIIAVSAGVKKAVAHPGDPLSIGARLALAGGVAAFLLGSAAFRAILGLPGGRARALTGLLALVTIPVGGVSAVLQLGLVAVLLAVALAVEERADRLQPV